MGCDRPCRRRRSTRRYFNPRIPYGMRLTRRNSPNCSTYFNPRIPYGMRRASMHVPVHVLEFQSTHPVWDATTPPAVVCWMLTISIHASRMGCDPRHVDGTRLCADFNPRIPYGMRRMRPAAKNTVYRFQSTHPVWDATTIVSVEPSPVQFQSTHPVWDATILICLKCGSH